MLVKALIAAVVLFSLAGNTEVKVYKGTSKYTEDILATIRDGKVYEGTSTYRSDIRFSFDRPLTIEEFVAVWHAVFYVY